VKGGLPRLKVRAHGRRQSFADNEHDCRHCMRCVAACPEDAIQVVAR
jgi:ferredoxin